MSNPQPKRRMIGDDFKGLCNQVAAQLEKEAPERLAREKAEAERYHYTGGQTYYVLVRGGQGQPVSVETIEEFPLVGRLKAEGRNYDVAISNLRFKYACELVRLRILHSQADALEYCTKPVFRVNVGL